MTLRSNACLAGAALLLMVAHTGAQSTQPKPYGRVSFYVTGDRRAPDGAEPSSDFQFATSVTFKIPDANTGGLETGIDLRDTFYSGGQRPQTLSIYDGYVGARLGSRGQFRVRAGQMWLPDLGTAGALAGGLVEYRQAPSGAARRLVAGAFMGAEPVGPGTGYAPGVKKYGGYLAFESGYLRRHVVGFANIRQGSLTERSMLTAANYIPVGKSFFAYQALEYDVKGPASGAAKGGLSYFLINARQSAGSRLELQGTYNRGRSINARQLTADVLNGRALSSQAVDGFRYETAGGRVSVHVARQVELYAGYARDRNNRDDAPTGRVTIGGYAGHILGTGFDLAGSDARIDRPTGPYHSRYFSVGRAVSRSLYLSGEYATSLAVLRFLRSDGVTIETRPWTRRFSGNMSATLNRQFSLVGVFDVTKDEALTDLRMMTGLTYRMR